ncbi:MAG: 50S ribosomal protein L18 [Candidatus Heimdallarchaeota archaeon]
MARNANYHVPFRRRREGKTNFHRRRRLLRSKVPRLVVRRSNKHERVSMIKAKVIGDESIIDASSQQLKKYGWKGATGNVPSSYLTGYLAGKYALALGYKEANLDVGINTCRKNTRVSAMLCGAVKAGLKIPHDPEVFPSEDRYTGKHIADYAVKLKKDDAKQYALQFADYKKRSAKPESIPTYFKATVKAINDEFAAGTMKSKIASRAKKNKVVKPKTTTKPKAAAKPKTTAKPKATTKKTTTTKPKTTTTTKKTTAAPKKTTSTTKKTTSTTTKSQKKTTGAKTTKK